ncbi:hypothetical protein CMV_021414 [Castanea mollissima]|uniref:Uncharacterized protein n=1 Tax=Castanea mollissima TaxID=60419 RepID=A0A8J4QW83_9ROSI|nr:hypothetical protein CMV_021414 [Castanea mollissima]
MWNSWLFYNCICKLKLLCLSGKIIWFFVKFIDMSHQRRRTRSSGNTPELYPPPNYISFFPRLTGGKVVQIGFSEVVWYLVIRRQFEK